jgi:2-methylisocitrate lyase-like PEP mutase family enzyme
MPDPAAILRARLGAPGIITAPGVSDGLSAQMAAEAGFDVLYMTGAGVSLGTFGAPDVGLLTLTEMAAACARITSATDLPLIADADTGYGNAVNLTRTVEEFIRAGAAGIQIEDQETPKKCGHLEGKRVVPAEEMALKIEAARAARGDSGLVIVARTDARQSLGMDEAINRSRLYREAGADVLFLEAPQGEEEIARVPRELDAPCLMNMAGKSVRIPVNKLEEFGYKIAIFPGEAQRASAFAMREVFETLREEGGVESIRGRLIDFEERFRIAGYGEIQKLEEKYLPKSE